MAGPQQPDRKVATWQFAIAELDLTTAAFLTNLDVVRYTRRDSDYCELAIQVNDRTQLNLLEGAAYNRVLRAWRNGLNRFNGQFVEVRETADSWELVAKDPFFNLNWRDVREAVKYTATDAGMIAWDLIDTQNGYSNTYLQMGSIDTSVDRTRSYIVGDRVSEKIQYLTMLEDGFSFTIDGVDGTPDVWAEFVVHYPIGDTLREKAKFEFGNGTIENCDDYLRESLPLVNRKNVVGNNPQLVVSVESGTSPALHGLWEGDRGQVMTNDTSQLSDIAAGAITDAPVYSIVMSAGPEAPQLFTDFDVGEKVPIVVRRAGRTIVGNKRVKEAVVLLDANSGAEELESLEVYE